MEHVLSESCKNTYMIDNNKRHRLYIVNRLCKTGNKTEIHLGSEV